MPKYPENIDEPLDLDAEAALLRDPAVTIKAPKKRQASDIPKSLPENERKKEFARRSREKAKNKEERLKREFKMLAQSASVLGGVDISEPQPHIPKKKSHKRNDKSLVAAVDQKELRRIRAQNRRDRKKKYLEELEDKIKKLEKFSDDMIMSMLEESALYYDTLPENDSADDFVETAMDSSILEEQTTGEQIPPGLYAYFEQLRNTENLDELSEPERLLEPTYSCNY